jgi:hypothetical protein
VFRRWGVETRSQSISEYIDAPHGVFFVFRDEKTPDLGQEGCEYIE